jgi:hypothetical protein
MARLVGSMVVACAVLVAVGVVCACVAVGLMLDSPAVGVACVGASCLVAALVVVLVCRRMARR